jgi:hypothetical protein
MKNLKKGIINELKYLNSLRKNASITEKIEIAKIKVQLYNTMTTIRLSKK